VSKEDENKLEELNRLAEAFSTDQDYGEEAANINLSILYLNPNSDAAHVRLARCSVATRHFMQAWEFCNEALRLNPNNVAARNLLTKVDTEQRLEQKVRQMAGDDYQTAFTLGVKARREERAGEAIAYFWYAIIELSPNATELSYCAVALAGAYRAKKDPASLDMAENLYKGVLEISPNNEAALTGLAAVLRDRGQHTRARKLYNQVLEQNQNDIYALRGIAGVQHDRGEVAQRQRNFSKAYALTMWQKRKAFLATHIGEDENR
jgi:tetratricopeptide (TPR) repeat protein